MSLGQKLRDRRERLGLDQHEIAQAAGVAQSSYCDWENGRMRPRRNKLDQLAVALKVSKARLTSWWAK